MIYLRVREKNISSIQKQKTIMSNTFEKKDYFNPAI